MTNSEVHRLEETRTFDRLYQSTELKIQRDDLLKLLTEFCEGKISAEEWFKFWKVNDRRLMDSMGQVNYYMLKPEEKFGIVGAAVKSQEAAAKVLNNHGKVARFSPRFREQWKTEFDHYVEDITRKKTWYEKLREKFSPSKKRN